MNLKLYQWRALRDNDLKTKAQAVSDTANAIVTDNTQSKEAASYGITSDAVTALGTALQNWGNVITAPQQAASKKRGASFLSF